MVRLCLIYIIVLKYNYIITKIYIFIIIVSLHHNFHLSAFSSMFSRSAPHPAAPCFSWSAEHHSLSARFCKHENKMSLDNCLQQTHSPVCYTVTITKICSLNSLKKGQHQNLFLYHTCNNWSFIIQITLNKHVTCCHNLTIKLLNSVTFTSKYSLITFSTTNT